MTNGGNDKNIKKLFDQFQLAHIPQNKIATFGQSDYEYIFISDGGEQQTALREGKLTVKIPLVVGPHTAGSVFQGFDDETKRVADRLVEKYGDQLRMLGYEFSHQPTGRRMLNEPLKRSMMTVSDMIINQRNTSLVIGEENHWNLAILKLILKIIEQSHSLNIAELEERGVFDSRGLPPALYEEVEHLFTRAADEPRFLKELGSLLVDKGLFEKYEERFFTVLKKHRG